MDINDALAQVDEWIVQGSAEYICVAPAHSLMECHNHPRLRQVFNSSGMNTPDGMGVVWLMRLKGHRRVQQVCGTELMLQVCQHGQEVGYRHYFYGSSPAVVEALALELKSRYPGMLVAGMYSPPFRALTAAEDRAITARINATLPDVVWVGLSSPKQEIWMHEHLGAIQAPVMIGVGAAFDFVSGAKRRAPRWMQQVGLEWFFRLASEPKRLWPRYRQYPLFVWLVLCEMLGFRRFTD